MELRYPFGRVQPKAGDPMVCNPSLLLWLLPFPHVAVGAGPHARAGFTSTDCLRSPAWSPWVATPAR